MQRIEREYRLGPDLAALDDWVQGLELDDLGCVVATGDCPELAQLPDGMVLEQAKARGYEVLRSAPEHIRRLFNDADEETK